MRASRCSMTCIFIIVCSPLDVMSPRGCHGLSGLVKYLEVMLRIQIVSNYSRYELVAFSQSNRSIAHIFDSFDIEATLETVADIAIFPHRGYRSTDTPKVTATPTRPATCERSPVAPSPPHHQAPR
jgi:hypothetical protein